MNDRQQARIAVAAGALLFMGLPAKLTLGPIWVAPLIVALLLLPVVAMAPTKLSEGRLVRIFSIVVIAILNLFNVISVVLLINDLLNIHAAGHADVSATQLLRSGVLIWMTNIIVFALWFWELDGAGPFDRARHASANDFEDPDFLFPQMSIDPDRVRGLRGDWKPMFLDYLYLSFTNALAVSPTDVMPLTRTAKMLMLVESLISFTTVALILARSVNILS